MNKPVLFLDFDGPLFPDNFIRHSRPMSEYPGTRTLHPFITYWEMSQCSVRQLNHLYSIYQFDTVVSSSWKRFVDKEDVEDLFKANGLNLHLHEDWCTPSRMSSYRVNDISWWLDKKTHPESYMAPDHMILDDPWSGSYLEDTKDFALREPYLVNPDLGIDSDIYSFMVSTVTSWAGDPLSRVYRREWPDRDYGSLDLG